MGYLSEFRGNLRPLAAAGVGIGTGTALFAYSASVFVPHLVKEFNWSRAEFALVGMTILAALLIAPVAGRLTDRLGVFPMAVAGVFLLPLCLAAFAFQQGEVWHYLVIALGVQVAGCLTSGLIYTRLVAERFHKATGLALTVVNCTPALLAMGTVPALNWFIESHGWRSGYLAVAAFTFLGGLTALWLIPPRAGVPAQTFPANGTSDSTATKPARTQARTPASRQDYRRIFGSKVFWIIFAGMFLCLLQTPLHAAQMNLMLVENGITAQTAANIVTVYAFGTLVGRLACGVALDRFPTPVVTAVSMALPAIGFFLLGTDWNTVRVIAFSMFLVGLSVGAESDLNPYLVARYFKLPIYNTTLGLVFLVNYLAAAVGALGISVTLKAAGNYTPFLFAVSLATAVGGLLFLLMPWRRHAEKVG